MKRHERAIIKVIEKAMNSSLQHTCWDNLLADHTNPIMPSGKRLFDNGMDTSSRHPRRLAVRDVTEKFRVVIVPIEDESELTDEKLTEIRALLKKAMDSKKARES